MLFAVIPAAGQSTRMGRPKLSLPLGDRTVIEWTVGSLRSLTQIEVIVVIGPHTPELAPLARTAGAHVLELPVATPDMRTTVQHGLAWIEERFQPQSADTWLLCPADVAVVDSDVVRALADSTEPHATIWIPTYTGRRGHPVKIAWRHVPGIRTFAPGRGLNEYLRQFPAETIELPVTSDTILLDLDTPEDYTRLQESLV